ncbi:MAG TPA: dTDP-4-dehydrorhamnose 3,5-epimerase [Chitinophagales bacterium]|nr:dTDP-4-dehydrorhamnose 3,5-epimerase [Chitinophagales bacterium]HRK27284.1 dTDP-4-dehydrorhamnose 3,5-epimerase [Chitinophagales bacterium]
MFHNPLPFIEPTGIAGLLVLNPRVYTDERGYFFESYNRRLLEKHGLFYDFVQDNQAFSKYGVVRGLHYQLEPFEQAKLVRVTQGLVFDVAVDLRGGSPTFGKWFGILLSDQNKKQLLIPRGFAHGYSVLSPTAEFVYKCDNYYSQKHEAGIVFNDPLLNINWQLPEKDMLVSEKDRMLAFFTDARYNFSFSG